VGRDLGGHLRTRRQGGPLKQRARAAFLAAAWLAHATPAAAVGERVFVEIEAPEEGIAIRSPVPLVEIRGWAGTGLRGTHDVLLAVDRSLSAWRPSGSDIDGDGEIGRMREDVRDSDNADHPFWTTDAGDTIYRAEVLAAGKLIERLDPARTHMGLITFGGGGEVRAPLGSSASELAQALYHLPAHGDGGGTNFSVAIKRAIAEFERNGEKQKGRTRSLMLLSDGFPSTGQSPKGERVFIDVAARRAREAGVRIYGFAIGRRAVQNPEALQALTRQTGGDLMLVTDPAEVIELMPYTSLTGVERVEIDNLSTSASARSVRVFPDGTFDAYAPLHAGLNVLRVTAYTETGDTRVLDRRVFFERLPADTPQRRAEARRLLRDLQVRTIEMELAARARQKRKQARWRELDIQVEDDD